MGYLSEIVAALRQKGEPSKGAELGKLALGKQVLAQQMQFAPPMPAAPPTYRWSIHFASQEELSQFHSLVSALVDEAAKYG